MQGKRDRQRYARGEPNCGDGQMTERSWASEGADFAQRRYGVTTKLLSYLSGAWCGTWLLAISILITYSSGNQIAETLLSRGDNQERFFGRLLAGAVFGLFMLGFGVACGRFLLRALPPAMSDQGRIGRSRAIAFYAAFTGFYIYGVFGFVALKPQAAIGAPLLAMLWTIGAVGLLIHRHRRPRAFLDRPFVLFLRRFSTFSDRAVIALVLQQAANKVPVVFLTPTISRPGDWDPYLVGFAGLHLWHLWRSAPITIRVQDSAWQRAADELIRRAHTILLDTSETSSALRTETEMIDRAGRWPDTVCLNASSSEVPPLSGARVIDYTKSWMRALPRMVIGFVIVLFGAFFFFLAGVITFDSSLLALVVVVVAAPAYYYSVFVRPSINKEARVALGSLFRAAHATSTDREAPQGIKGWLILPVIWLIISPIGAGYLLLTQFWPIFRDGAWEQLTTPGTAVYHHLWGPLITYEIIGMLVITVLAMTTLVLLFRKSKKAPVFAIAWLGINAVFVFLDSVFAGLIPAAAQTSASDLRAVSFAIAGAILFIPYFIVSCGCGLPL